jgi:uncharacterized protein (TIGR02246 family)
MTDAKRQLIDYIDNWYKEFPNADAAALAALYTKDARLMLANLSAQRGSAAIGAMLAAMAGYADSSIRHEVTDVEMLTDDLALITGSAWATSIIKSTGAEHKDASRFFMVMKKGQDGIWRCHYDLSQPTPDVAFSD